MIGNQFWADCEIGGNESSLTSQSSLSDMDSNGLLNGKLTHEDQIILSDKDNYEITVSQKDITKRMSTLSVNCPDEFQLDLFHTLKASNAPLVLYDRMISLIKRHQSSITTYGANSLKNRKTLINGLNNGLYGDKQIMKPSVHNLVLSSVRSTNIVTFSMKDMVLWMVNNKLLFHPGNLLLDPDNPCALPKDTPFYGDVNSDSWHKNAIAKECTNPQHILMPFCHFIDGLAINKYGNINVEAVLTCCLYGLTENLVVGPRHGGYKVL